MFKRFPVFLVGLTLASPSLATAQVEGSPPGPAESEVTPTKPSADGKFDSAKREMALRVQLFLDKETFGPGKIDGRWGGFSRKAAERWNASGRAPKIAITADGELDLDSAAQLPLPGALFITYRISPADQSAIGSLPQTPESMSKLDRLPYADVLELVAEKFHADPDFIREVNGIKGDAGLQVGAELKVPDVSEPFELSVPMGLAKSAAEAAAAKGKGSKEEKAKKRAGGSDQPAADSRSPPAREVTVLRDERVVEVREGGQLIHSFPISPGARDNRSPEGSWKVSTISWMPEFRWDKSMLEDGTRGDDAFLLPPGPNNPVGIVWIGISADGIGLHGTSEPDAIGRNQSHGCIRLSNWDALTLGKLVAPGTPVVIR